MEKADDQEKDTRNAREGRIKVPEEPLGPNDAMDGLGRTAADGAHRERLRRRPGHAVEALGRFLMVPL